MSARVALGLTLWSEPFSLEKSGNHIAKIAGSRSFGCLRPSTIEAKAACERRDQSNPFPSSNIDQKLKRSANSIWRSEPRTMLFTVPKLPSLRSPVGVPNWGELVML
jgi:hypothetical protein